MITLRDAIKCEDKLVAVGIGGRTIVGKVGAIDEQSDDGPEIEYSIRLWSDELMGAGFYSLPLKEIDRIEILDM